MRVVTYNVRGFRDGREGVAAVVRDLAPDVLLLQESGARHELRRFASDLGLDVASDPWSPLRRRVKNAVLVADRWRFTSNELVRFARSTRRYPRGALVAGIRNADTGAGPTVISIHLGLDGDERGRQTDDLVRLVAAFGDAPLVVGGDLNVTPDHRAPSRIASVLRDGWIEAGGGDGATFPARAPSARIDYVFVGGPVAIRTIKTGGVAAAVASDHLPVIVDLQIG